MGLKFPGSGFGLGLVFEPVRLSKIWLRACKALEISEALWAFVTNQARASSGFWLLWCRLGKEPGLTG